MADLSCVICYSNRSCAIGHRSCAIAYPSVLYTFSLLISYSKMSLETGSLLFMLLFEGGLP